MGGIACVQDDALVEVTPKSIRLRKRYLDPHECKRQSREAETAIDARSLRARRLDAAAAEALRCRAARCAPSECEVLCQALLMSIDFRAPPIALMKA